MMDDDKHNARNVIRPPLDFVTVYDFALSSHLQPQILSFMGVGWIISVP